jgi:hypothetical protein
MFAEPQAELVRPGSESPRPISGALIIVALALVLSVRAFCTVCAGFRPWDDMGYLMLTQKTLAAGHPLYDQTFSQYGPGYYVWARLLRGLLGVPLSHDSTLLLTAAARVAVALLCAGYVARLSRSVFLTALTCFAVFHVLAVLDREPGHPQEFCALLLGGMLLAASFLTGGRRVVVNLGAIGFLIGLLAMTKPNLGVFAALAGWVSLSNLVATRWSRHLLFGAGALTALALPLALMRHNLDGAGPYCLLESGTILLLLARLVASQPERSLPLKALVAPAGGCLAGLLVCAGYALATGTSPGGLAHGLVLQHLGFDRAFSFWPAFGYKEVLLSLGVASLVLIATRRGRGQKAARLSTLVKIGVPSLLVLLALWPGVTVGAVFTACLPLIVATGQPSAQQPKSACEVAPRQFAVSLAVLTALWGYPVWASQAHLSLFLLIPVAMVGCADGIRYGYWQFGGRDSALWHKGPRIALSHLAALVLVGLSVFSAAGEAGTYSRMEPSGLRGSRLLHMPREQGDLYRRIIQSARAHGRSFYTMPGLGSLYFWAAADPPTCINPTAWMTLLTPAQQAKVVEDLQKAPDLCVIRWDLLVKFWVRDLDISGNKVVRYIEENFVLVESFEGFDILARRPPAPKQPGG